MQNLIGLEQFWELLDSKDVLALSQVCRLVRKFAYQYRCNILVLGIFGKRISRHLNTIDYSCFRSAFKLVNDLIPKNDTITLLQKERNNLIPDPKLRHFWSPMHTLYNPRLHEFQYAARQVLSLEDDFSHYVPYRLSLPPGSHHIDEFYSPDLYCKALVGVTFKIPAGEVLSASIIIGEQTLCQYMLFRDSSHRTIEDSPLFNHPLIINHKRFGGFPLTIDSNCQLELHMTHMRFLGDDFLTNDVDLPHLEPDCLTYLVRSPFKKNDDKYLFFKINENDGLAGWVNI